MITSDYEAIRAEHERDYGRKIEKYGKALLADRYDDRTHFIFELLQNAEDALRRRMTATGPRSVRFHLATRELRVSHFGKPFDELDVRSICGIAESTKEMTAIGRFGIGFKSVFLFTERPEIHSGSENFAIESFVWPIAVPPVARDRDETLIVIPLSADTAGERGEITTGLRRLGPSSLLFLREIEEIEWSSEDGPSGVYLRSKPEIRGEGVRCITVVGQEEGKPDIEETWLLFSKPVVTFDGVSVGHVELAFSVLTAEKSTKERIGAVGRSPLVVFFPTVRETHLGFLVQGPYRTTPSRDNVPPNDEWNQHCVKETSVLLVDGLCWLRDNAMLDTGALRSLPLDRTKFGEGVMFAPLFHATKRALATEALLPRFGGGYVAARGARLARTQELRELLDPMQLTALFGDGEELAWLSGDISEVRTPDLHHYLTRELEIAEITPALMLSRLDTRFLEAQADDWILRLYEFLNEQTSLHQKAGALPLIRLVDGTHVKSRENDQPRAFLPGAIETGFPTVRGSVSSTEAALAFLRAIGLNEPDAADDVIQNILPKYRAFERDVDDVEYDSDIKRIVTAWATTDSTALREKLLAALRQTPFVMALDAGGAGKRASKPGELCLATDRLKKLFTGVAGVLLVDDRYACLRGEEVRGLLEACGTVRYVRPTKDNSLSWEEKKELRTQTGYPDTSGQNDRVTDWMLLGLKDLLDSLASLDIKERRAKTILLWEELAHLEERQGKSVFTGDYTWTHYGDRRALPFDAAFVRMLNATEWIPDSDGNLCRPQDALFDSLGWKATPFLQSKIRFKPPILEQLAKEAGIEPGVIELLRKHGVTSVAELIARLGLQEEPQPGDDIAGTPPPVRPMHDWIGPEPTPPRGGGQREAPQGERPQRGTLRTPGSPGGRPFVSYVGAHPDEGEKDPDGLDHATRMALEARAIDFILDREPNWHRTPAFNPGYDLFEAGPDAQPARWCEVKAMTGSLDNRPVGLSRKQFEFAREYGDDYWLYVVEHAGDEGSRIVRIQNPAGKTRTFTFDRGWINVARLDDSGEIHQPGP